MKNLDAYTVLKIAPGATRKQIHEAYRALARRWHPDRFPEGPERDWANEKMAEINAAYASCMRDPRTAGASARNGGESELKRIEALIDRGECTLARKLLMALDTRCARWNYLFGALLMKNGEREKARIYLSVAAHQQPDCKLYAQALRDAGCDVRKIHPLFGRFMH